MDDIIEEKLGLLEAVLFVVDEPVDAATIALTTEIILEGEVEDLVRQLENRYREGGHAITIQRVAGGWRLATRERYAEIIKRMFRGRLKTRLSRAALETVSIVAYRQPISRAEIEAIRGVDPGPVLRNLLERGLVRIAGRAEAPGRPLLYATTDEFLTYFGLDTLQSLPKPEELFLEAPDLPVAKGQQGPFKPRDGSPEEDRDETTDR